MDKNTNQSVQLTFKQAVKHHTENNLKEAKKLYEKVIEFDPNHADAHNNLGIIFSILGDLEKAKNCYEETLKINPKNFNAYNNMGNIFKELGDIKNAIFNYEKAIEFNPKHLNAYNNLGLIFYDLGEYIKSIYNFKEAVKIDQKNIASINGLSSSLELFEPNKKLEDYNINFKNIFLFLLKNNNIDHSIFSNKIIRFFFLDNEELKILINSETPLLSNKLINVFMKEEIFHLVLQKSLILNKSIEKLITRLRSEILFKLDDINKDSLKEYHDFIISLAEQNWLNEYVNAETQEEINEVSKLKEKIEKKEQINEIEIAVLGSYIPLNRFEIIIKKLLNYSSSNNLFNDLINLQIKEPIKEKELIKSLKSLNEIIDPVSKKVRAQYEKNPYPRWRFTKRYIPNNFCQRLNNQIKPNKIICDERLDSPNILIAGCGTGSHPISATRYKNSNIIGVDLSLSSLGYAKRKVNELDHENIKFLHTDILHLKKLNKKFDVIESSGVIHHMKDPIEGLKILVEILEPHGFLRLGLYSELARQNVVKARKFIEDNNYKDHIRDIKIFRKAIIDNDGDKLLNSLTESEDFYTMSAVRDLLFHVQEHRFTIPEISEILSNLKLEFLGFDIPNPSIKKEYSKIFPNDKKNISLDNWHQFETDNPETFGAMYQFWVKRS
tara:strand:- start:226 stop:2223 length:1998 start_codon:yes stop_codon:yes gene_type:complete